MERVGRVVSVNDGMAELEVRKVSSCGTNCASCQASCAQPPQLIKVYNTLQAKPGDFVEIKADSNRILKYMLVLYGIPLLFLIVGFIVGDSYFRGKGSSNYELMSLLVGILSMLVGGLVVRAIDKKTKVKSENINYMIRIL